MWIANKSPVTSRVGVRVRAFRWMARVRVRGGDASVTCMGRRSEVVFFLLCRFELRERLGIADGDRERHLFRLTVAGREEWAWPELLLLEELLEAQDAVVSGRGHMGCGHVGIWARQEHTSVRLV